MQHDFISEDDLKTFEGWLRYQAVDAAALTQDALETWRTMFDEVRERSAATPKVGLMKLRPVHGEYRYAVALRQGSDLWLALWVKRSRKGEFFVLLPCGNRDWDPHTSYHLDGTVHMKSHGRTSLRSNKRQPLTDAFPGTESLGAFFGYAPKSVGAICDPKAFSSVVEIAPGVLGPQNGGITVDLVVPGCELPSFDWTEIVRREVFREIVPWVAITIGKL